MDLTTMAVLRFGVRSGLLGSANAEGGTSGSERRNELERNSSVGAIGGGTLGEMMGEIVNLRQENEEIKMQLDKQRKMEKVKDSHNSTYTWYQEWALLKALVYSAGRLSRDGWSYEEIAREMRCALFWGAKSVDHQDSESLYTKYEKYLPEGSPSCRDSNSLKLKWKRLVNRIANEGSNYLNKFENKLTQQEKAYLRELAKACKKLDEERKAERRAPNSVQN